MDKFDYIPAAFVAIAAFGATMVAWGFVFNFEDISQWGVEGRSGAVFTSGCMAFLAYKWLRRNWS